jgi:outer membrane protein assembly factor BamB
MRRLLWLLALAISSTTCYKDEGEIPQITAQTIIYPDVQPNLLWSTDLHENTEGFNYHSATVKTTHNDIVIIFEDWTTLIALNKNDGSIIWKTSIKDVVHALPINPQNFMEHYMNSSGTVVIIGDELFYLSERAKSIPVFNVYTGDLIELRLIEGRLADTDSPGFPSVYKDGILYFVHTIRDFTLNNTDAYIYKHDLAANTIELAVAVVDRHLLDAGIEIAVDFERSKAYFVSAVWKPLFPGNISMHKLFEADLVTGNYRIVWEEQKDGYINFSSSVFFQYPYFLVDGFTYHDRVHSFNIETGDRVWNKETFLNIKLINGQLYAMDQNTYTLDFATGATSLVLTGLNDYHTCFNSLYPYITTITFAPGNESAKHYFYCSIVDARSTQRLISWRAADEQNPYYEVGYPENLSFNGAPYFDQEAGLIYIYDYLNLNAYEWPL